MSSKGKIIVTGILFWYPLAGVTYQFLHYLLGLRRLGYDPYYIEDSELFVYDPRINAPAVDASENIRLVTPLLEAHGFAGHWAFRGNHPSGYSYGMSRGQILRLYRDSIAILNVTGGQQLRSDHLVCPRRIYIESDPFLSQIRVAEGDAVTIAKLELHDTHFSFGENLGEPDCGVPPGRFRWLPTRQPVILDLWDNSSAVGGAAYNSITTWRNRGKTITYRGETYYWTKDRQFEEFLDLPRRRSVPFELAVTPDDRVERVLVEHGWRYMDATKVSAHPDDYRAYIQRSRAEFTVARDQYVRPRTGWFSDRSACYLAAGRPVITQETGFSKFLPTGKGLFGFTAMDDILAAVDEIERDYEGNCRAAREIAAEYFSAERVLTSLLERAGL